MSDLLTFDVTSETAVVEQINAALARTSDPLERAALRTYLDVYPGLYRALLRELPQLSAHQTVPFVRNLSHSIVSSITLTAAEGQEMPAKMLLGLTLRSILLDEMARIKQAMAAP